MISNNTASLSNRYAQEPLELELPMQKLADRLSTMVPPPAAAHLARPSPAVAKALRHSRAISERSARYARKRSIIAVAIDGFVAACAFIPYALVALALRLVIARVFFLSGQTKIDGPRVPLNIRDFEFSVVLPQSVSFDTISQFMSQYAALPLPPVFAAHLVSYAEFFLPILLVLGLATRFAAFGLLIMTAMIQLYVLPGALWSVHVYWAAILLVLMSSGPGPISVDHIIRFIARR